MSSSLPMTSPTIRRGTARTLGGGRPRAGRRMLPRACPRGLDCALMSISLEKWNPNPRCGVDMGCKGCKALLLCVAWLLPRALGNERMHAGILLPSYTHVGVNGRRRHPSRSRPEAKAAASPASPALAAKRSAPRLLFSSRAAREPAGHLWPAWPSPNGAGVHTHVSPPYTTHRNALEQCVRCLLELVRGGASTCIKGAVCKAWSERAARCVGDWAADAMLCYASPGEMLVQEPEEQQPATHPAPC
jgi:hypothetical protein